ncbi:ADP-ribosylation factor [Tieghemostelium lacteum]|uniref:ADP-ribosylation factor n=1 Tax=Tieghemostelium lacteum TaxID=361077 RepID=A0A152A969_TIELA|nr:ADP-ribosylation factor [Tieghemostelium lacteum]|eukprot:KYR02675.1 ADP-ribosylation factor [Tieghemostelium lacteum]
MGNLLSNIYQLFDAKKHYRLLMIGLDNAGKTSILYRMKLGENITTLPTIGFNVETVSYKNNLDFTVWDVGGQNKIRVLWRHYYQNSSAIIFVLDSADRERISEAKDEIDGLLDEDSLRGAPLLILANKQDIPTALSIAEISEQLNLYTIKDRKWFIQSTSAINGQGIYEGFEFVSKTLSQK